MKKITEKEMREKAKKLEPYQNKWVALVDDQVVASGETPQEVERKAEKKGYTDVVFHLVSPSRISIFPL
jgi:glutamine phosphoribosylpyrophosphate amidotransferase